MFHWMFRTTAKKSARRPQRSHRTCRPLGGERLESRELLAGDLLTSAAVPGPGTCPAALVGSFTTGTAGGSFAPAASPAAASKLSATQVANLQQLATDLQAIHASSSVTLAMVQQLVKDTAILLQGTTKPSQASVQTLTGDLKSFTADGKLTALEVGKLQKDLTQVLTEANIPPAELAAVVADVQAIVTASGVTPAQVQTIHNDILAILKEAAATHGTTVP